MFSVSMKSIHKTVPYHIVKSEMKKRQQKSPVKEILVATSLFNLEYDSQHKCAQDEPVGGNLQLQEAKESHREN